MTSSSRRECHEGLTLEGTNRDAVSIDVDALSDFPAFVAAARELVASAHAVAVLPYDCIGSIVGFVDSSRDFFNLLMASHRFYDYLTGEGGFHCNVLFRVRICSILLTKRNLSRAYIQRMELDYPVQKSRSLVDPKLPWLRHFRHLREVILRPPRKEFELQSLRQLPPTVTSLTLRFLCLDQSRVELFEEVLRDAFPRLMELRIQGPLVVSCPTQNVRLPPVGYRTLSFEGWDFPAVNLKDCLASSAATLRHLSLCSVLCAGDDLAQFEDLLVSMTKLTSLSFDAYNLGVSLRNFLSDLVSLSVLKVKEMHDPVHIADFWNCLPPNLKKLFYVAERKHEETPIGPVEMRALPVSCHTLHLEKVPLTIDLFSALDAGEACLPLLRSLSLRDISWVRGSQSSQLSPSMFNGYGVDLLAETLERLQIGPEGFGIVNFSGHKTWPCLYSFRVYESPFAAVRLVKRRLSGLYSHCPVLRSVVIEFIPRDCVTLLQFECCPSLRSLDLKWDRGEVIPDLTLFPRLQEFYYEPKRPTSFAVPVLPSSLVVLSLCTCAGLADEMLDLRFLEELILSNCNSVSLSASTFNGLPSLKVLEFRLSDALVHDRRKKDREFSLKPLPSSIRSVTVCGLICRRLQAAHLPELTRLHLVPCEPPSSSSKPEIKTNVVLPSVRELYLENYNSGNSRYWKKKGLASLALLEMVRCSGGSLEDHLFALGLQFGTKQTIVIW